MNSSERKKLYKKALKDYKKGLENFPESNDELTINNGFCAYFSLNHDLYTYDDFKSVLPELYRQRRTKKKDSNFHYEYPGTIKKGLKQRVKALKRAIKMLD